MNKICMQIELADRDLKEVNLASLGNSEARSIKAEFFYAFF